MSFGVIIFYYFLLLIYYHFFILQNILSVLRSVVMLQVVVFQLLMYFLLKSFVFTQKFLFKGSLSSSEKNLTCDVDGPE